MLAGHAGKLGPIWGASGVLSVIISVNKQQSPPLPYPRSLLSCPWYVFISIACFDSEYVQIHALVAQGSTILAEHQAGKRDFSQGPFQKHAVTSSRSTSQPSSQPRRQSYQRYHQIIASSHMSGSSTYSTTSRRAGSHISLWRMIQPGGMSKPFLGHRKYSGIVQKDALHVSWRAPEQGTTISFPYPLRSFMRSPFLA
jgi:hypothetical protein